MVSSSAISSDNGTPTQSFFAAKDIDLFYQRVLGEHSHCGIFKHPDEELQPAKERTTEYMASLLSLTQESRLVDLGAGYGGAARYLASTYGCQVSCLNLSEQQNEINIERNRAANLSGLVDVHQGIFDALPFADASFNVAWSQDALHYSNTQLQAVREAHRVLAKGGELLISNYFLREDKPSEADKLRAIELYTSGTHKVYFLPRQDYQDFAVALGMREVQFIDLTENVAINFSQDVKKMEELQASENLWSDEFFETKTKRLLGCVELGKSGLIQWGIMHYYKD
ncbi:MAG: methyltransferase domain-containing protein [Cyanobacteria bacterium P01_F01_bin.53]